MPKRDNGNTDTLSSQYDELWETLNNGRPSLADLTAFNSVARAYAQTPDGERRIYDDLARSQGTLCTILQDIIDNQSPATKTSGEVTTPRGYVLTSHVVEQAKAKGFSLENLIMVADEPSTVYESRRYPGQVKHIRDGLCVAVDPADKRVITVFVDQDFTERRADQIDDDALAYEHKLKNAQKN